MGGAVHTATEVQAAREKNGSVPSSTRGLTTRSITQRRQGARCQVEDLPGCTGGPDMWLWRPLWQGPKPPWHMVRLVSQLEAWGSPRPRPWYRGAGLISQRTPGAPHACLPATKGGVAIVALWAMCHWHFDGRTASALDDLTIDFHRVSLTCIVGSSGGSKSVLLQMLVRELPLFSGTLCW